MDEEIVKTFNPGNILPITILTKDEVEVERLNGEKSLNEIIELLEKYDMNASLFLITAWWPRSKYESPNLEIYSHGHDIHLDNYCKKGPRGYCLTKEELIEDFSLSIPLVDNNLAFCYPFYAYNDTIIDALKELDFKLAFIGGNRKAKITDNKLLLPRYIIYRNTDINIFKTIVN